LEARQHANLTDMLVAVGEAEMDQALAAVPAGTGLLKPRAVRMGESLVEEDLTDSRGFKRATEQVWFERLDDDPRTVLDGLGVSAKCLEVQARCRRGSPASLGIPLPGRATTPRVLRVRLRK